MIELSGVRNNKSNIAPLKNKENILDRFGRTPKATMNPIKDSDSMGSSPEAITVFKS